ncbi:hypothetical protein GCM10023219_09580 [Stakelama sediminis]|uniref:Cytoskeletal protein CcmA (Bactofilin family) n=1 Tax=Stakelama sediminis TaxID=463200 RepID=A0A840YVU2_9SPHN|nr:polymer-forming cytoskeletal protein [Stakelama sediminis]MBB5717680.1 cytoskeletal protein CcmA (bactofilin family) [Stakelama sediminis]
MFKSTDKPTREIPSIGKRGEFSIFSADVTVAGNVSAQADLHIDGRIEGDVTCQSLVLGAGSHVQGEICADSARIAGTVEGGVRVRDLTIEHGAQVTGDVEYENLSIATGARVDGTLRHVGANMLKQSAVGTKSDHVRLIESAAEAG